MDHFSDNQKVWLLVLTNPLGRLEFGLPCRTAVQKPGNDPIPPVNTDKQRLPVVSRWCEMDFVHPEYCWSLKPCGHFGFAMPNAKQRE